MIGQSMLERFDRLRVLAIMLFAVMAILGGFFVGVAVAGAEAVLRAKDPKGYPSNQLPVGLERITLDGHLHYWRKIHRAGDTMILIHAAGCTNHVACQ